jgi:hypothetical protein
MMNDIQLPGRVTILVLGRGYILCDGQISLEHLAISAKPEKVIDQNQNGTPVDRFFRGFETVHLITKYLRVECGGTLKIKPVFMSVWYLYSVFIVIE